jgi:predicted NAD-dependent protein-ADP-ribosyltransferase YbiA (DUF1768 family)
MPPSPTGRPSTTATTRAAPHVLVEGNTWGDVFWGAVRYAPEVEAAHGILPYWYDDQDALWVGHNWLGRTLMMVRDLSE